MIPALAPLLLWAWRSGRWGRDHTLPSSDTPPPLSAPWPDSSLSFPALGWVGSCPLASAQAVSAQATAVCSLVAVAMLPGTAGGPSAPEAPLPQAAPAPCLASGPSPNEKENSVSYLLGRAPGWMGRGVSRWASGNRTTVHELPAPQLPQGSRPTHSKANTIGRCLPLHRAA